MEPKKDFTDRIAPFLRILFYGMMAIFPLQIVFDLMDRKQYEPTGFFWSTVIFTMAVGMLAVLALFFIYVVLWVFHFHKEMKQVTPSYEISKWGSVGRMFIPIYNLFGIYEIIKTAAIEIKGGDEGEGAGKNSRFVLRALPVFYALSLFSNIADKIFFSDKIKKNLDLGSVLALGAIEALLNIAVFFLWLKIFEALHAGFQSLKKAKLAVVPP